MPEGSLYAFSGSRQWFLWLYSYYLQILNYYILLHLTTSYCILLHLTASYDSHQLSWVILGHLIQGFWPFPGSWGCRYVLVAPGWLPVKPGDRNRGLWHRETLSPQGGVAGWWWKRLGIQICRDDLDGWWWLLLEFIIMMVDDGWWWLLASTGIEMIIMDGGCRFQPIAFLGPWYVTPTCTTDLRKRAMIREY